LERAIQSLIDQTYRYWECLVVDDFSQDSTKELVFSIADKESRIQYFENIEKGSNPARNLGLKKSKGNYVVFLDSDDALEPRMIEESLDIIEKTRQADLAISYTNIFKNGSLSMVSDLVRSENLLLDFLIKKITWPLNSALIRKDFLISNHIKFRPNLLNGQDYCFFLSIISNKPKIVFTNKALSVNYHLDGEPKNVKISAGDTMEYKWSRFRSRNLAFEIAFRHLSIFEFFEFIPYFTKYQTGLILDMVKSRF
jgi:glycosyltransferase involved in cell wall biosynthesis